MGDVGGAGGGAQHQQERRAQALLLAADEVANTQIAERLGISVVTVRAWRARLTVAGFANLGVVRAGRGRKPQIPAEKVEAIVHATLHSRPPGETH